MQHLIANCESKHVSLICPELVILDHYMPIMDGLEMIQALSGNHHSTYQWRGSLCITCSFTTKN
jgi:CheY-like chemotaxis protein